MVYLQTCPLCLTPAFDNFLTTQDHFLSKESFSIVECRGCGLRFTNPRPSEEELPAYYESKDYISHSNEKKGLVNKIYQWSRKISIAGKHTLISKYKQGGNLLDIGCGTGEFLNYMKNNGWKVTGIEPGDTARQSATEEYHLRVLPEEDLNTLPPGSFDVITLWHVLEHVPRLRERMDHITTLLKDKGLLILAVPMCNSWDATFYGEYWAAWDLPRHLYHFDKSSLLKLTAYYPLQHIEIIPMKLDAYYVSLLSEKYKKEKPSFLNAARNGLRSNMHAKKNNNPYSSLIFLFEKT